MSLFHSLRPLALALAAVMLAAHPVAAAPPLEAFGALPAIDKPALSPDGKRYAVVQSHQGKPIIAVFDLTAPEGTPPMKLGPGDGVIVTMAWASERHLIVILKANMRVTGDSQIRTWWRSIAVDVNKKTAVVLLTNVGMMRYNLGAAAISDLSLSDPDHVFMPLVSVNRNGTYVLNLYKVNLNDGRGQLAHSGTMWTAGWVMDDGNVVARIDTYYSELKYHITIPAGGGEFRDIGAFDLEGGGDAHVGGIAMDGKGLVMRMFSPSRREGLFRIDLTTLARTELYSHPQYDVAAVLQDEWTGRVIGAAYYADKVEFVYFDPRRQRFQGIVERAFPGRSVSISSCDLPAKSCLIRVEGPRDPTSYYRIDVDTMHATLLGNAYPTLTTADLGEMRSYPYAARDGLQIPAYLTLPPGREAKGLPLVVMPHGGPEGRDSIGFDWMAQFLASRGYAVLQPNFRGSAGYGAAFRSAGYHQWGLAMQTDLADGVARLAADGIVDPKRVCVFGLSYGGYAALAGAAFTPETYACAASVAGVFDLEEMLRIEERDSGRESAVVSYWKSRIGDRRNSADAARIRATSPAFHAGRINIPVLLMHATGDTTVPIAQSKTMRDAMNRARKPVQYIELDGDDHYLDLAATRIRVLDETEKFLKAHIGR